MPWVDRRNASLAIVILSEAKDLLFVGCQAAEKIVLRIRVCLQAYRKLPKMVPASAAGGSGEASIRASLEKGTASVVPPRANKEAGSMPVLPIS
jgi:hypothetical protein